MVRVYAIMKGGLHTEIALWTTLGDVLDGFGWISALIQATADSYLKVANLTSTRHAHQITLLTLHTL